jgi:hypothetical protein
MHVIDEEYGRAQSGYLTQVVGDIETPINRNQRSVRGEWVAVLFRCKFVDDFTLG